MTQNKGSIIKIYVPQVFRDGLELCTGGHAAHSVLTDGSATVKTFGRLSNKLKTRQQCI